MSASGTAMARAAEGLVGTPFRLHGRDPRYGLDCVGLVAEALARAGFPAVTPNGYALRNTGIAEFLQFAPAAGLRDAAEPFAPGDILLVRPGPAQFHLLICGTRAGFVHAHAGLRKAAVMPGPLGWTMLRHWRHQSSF